MDLHQPQNTNSLLDYLIRNKKRVNIAVNREAHSSLKEYLLIIESSQQRYAWVYTKIWNKQSKADDTTGSHWPIKISA